ncbi:O-antigen ligase family protein [Flavobacteriaceae bacterium]|nr:O-antigen ligase family protein [Flavobacteriaceae bacterium]MDC1492199.1 O-antigen ligase family protein [Flavobacteriaceae bacterium]
MRFSLDNIYTALFSILCFSLAFIGDQFYAIPNGINILLAILFPFIINKKYFFKSITKRPITWYVIFLIFILTKSVLLGYFLEDISVIKKLFQILLIIVLSLGLKPGSLDYLKSGIIFGTITAVFYSAIKIGILIINTASFNFTKGPLINETLPIQRLYLGLLCTISLILVIDRFFKTRKKINLFLGLIFILFVFLIAARIAIVSSILIIVYYVFSKIKSSKKYLALLLIAVATSTALILNGNLSKRFFHIDDDFRGFTEKIKTHEPRYEIWKYSYEILQTSSFFLGNGFNSTEEMLVSNYKKIPQLKKREWFIDKRFNTHNQYIDILLSQGIVGFILFLIFLIQLFRIAKRSDENLLLLISMLIYMMVYNNFHRVIGVFIFSIIIVFIFDKKYIQK